MAKFKVGDVVSVKREAAEMIDNPALARKRGRVTKVLPGGYYEVDGELGATGLELTDAELTLANSCRSTNAVVAKALNACRTARNAMQDAGSYVRECNKFIPEANAMIREWDAFYKKMTAKRKWYDSKMTELRDGFYSIDKGDPDYDKARAAYDALRDVSRLAEAVHLFYSV